MQNLTTFVPELFVDLVFRLAYRHIPHTTACTRTKGFRCDTLLQHCIPPTWRRPLLQWQIY